MDSSVVFFGRIGEEWWGLDLLLSRRDQRVDVVPPIPSSAARALGTDVARWSHWFLERLRQSDACPLHAGQWTLYAFDWSELVPDVDVVKANEFLLRWLSSDLMRYDEQGQASFDYGSHRAGATGVPVVPTRTLSRPDTARVKAMRRLAREGALPPLLVWEVSGVQGVLIPCWWWRLRECRGCSSSMVTIGSSLGWPRECRRRSSCSRVSIPAPARRGTGRW